MTPDRPASSDPRATPGATVPSLDGRRFASGDQVDGGEVGADTIFTYEQDGHIISATYRGGQIQRGYLIGTRHGDELDFRYVHLNTRDETASGRCRTRLEMLSGGRIKMHETWQWESRRGSGTSMLEEILYPGG